MLPELAVADDLKEEADQPDGQTDGRCDAPAWLILEIGHDRRQIDQEVKHELQQVDFNEHFEIKGFWIPGFAHVGITKIFRLANVAPHEVPGQADTPDNHTQRDDQRHRTFGCTNQEGQDC